MGPDIRQSYDVIHILIFSAVIRFKSRPKTVFELIFVAYVDAGNIHTQTEKS